MNPETRSTLKTASKAKAKAKAKAKPQTRTPDKLVEPTAAAMAQAVDRRAAAQARASKNLPPCHVVGLDYKKYASAIIDLDDKPGRIASARRAMAAKGYVRLEGDLAVVGFANAEAYVKLRAQYDADKMARRALIAANVKAGVMSDSAIAPSVVRTSRGSHTA